MSEIRQESPLVGFFSTGRESGASSPGVTVIERPFFGYVNLRGDVNDVSFMDAINNVLGVALPSSPSSLVETDDLNGPDFQPQFPECARVTIAMASGDAFTDFLGAATGMPSNPISDEALSGKFRTCASFAGWTENNADTLLARLWGIENTGPIRSALRGDA